MSQVNLLFFKNPIPGNNYSFVFENRWLNNVPRFAYIITG